MVPLASSAKHRKEIVHFTQPPYAFDSAVESINHGEFNTARSHEFTLYMSLACTCESPYGLILYEKKSNSNGCLL